MLRGVNKTANGSGVGDGDDIKWLIGIAITLSSFLGGAIIMAFHSLSASIKSGDDKLHERINRVCDEYVERVDRDTQMKQLGYTVKEIRDLLRGGQGKI